MRQKYYVHLKIINRRLFKTEDRYYPHIPSLINHSSPSTHSRQAQRKRDEAAAIVRRQQLAERRAAAALVRANSTHGTAAGRYAFIHRIVPLALMTRRSVYVTTAVSIFVGIYAYYYKSHLMATGIS